MPEDLPSTLSEKVCHDTLEQIVTQKVNITGEKRELRLQPLSGAVKRRSSATSLMTPFRRSAGR